MEGGVKQIYIRVYLFNFEFVPTNSILWILPGILASITIFWSCQNSQSKVYMDVHF